MTGFKVGSLDQKPKNILKNSLHFIISYNIISYNIIKYNIIKYNIIKYNIIKFFTFYDIIKFLHFIICYI